MDLHVPKLRHLARDRRLVAASLDRLVAIHPMLRSVHDRPVFRIRSSVVYFLLKKTT